MRFLPLSLLSFVVAPLAGRMSARVPIRALIGGGMALVGIALMLMRGLSASSEWTALLAGFIVAGIGVALVNAPLASTAVSVVPPQRAGMGSGINSTFRQVGIATGTAALGALFQHILVSDATGPLARVPAEVLAQGRAPLPGRRPTRRTSRSSPMGSTTSCWSRRSWPSSAPCSRSSSSAAATSSRRRRAAPPEAEPELTAAGRPLASPAQRRLRAIAWPGATLTGPMRRLIFLSLLCSLLLAAPAGAQLTHIRAGMSAAGVDLSGLTVPEATAKLDAELAPRLAPDLLIGVAGRPWVLKMADAKLKFDSSRTAKRALYAKAGLTQVPPAISHSHAAVAAFVADIAKQVGKPARDAKIKITLRHIYRQRSRPGRGLDVAVAAKAIDAAIDDPAAPRVLHQPLTRVRAKVNANDLARVYNTVITIDQAHFKLRLFKGLKFRKSYGVAVGQPAYPTPSRPLRDPEQAGQPDMVGAQLAVGRRAAGDDRGGRQRRQPAQGALDGHRQRRRDPRHRRGLLDRLARVARLHPHARRRRDRPVQARPGRDARADPVARGEQAARLALLRAAARAPGAATACRTPGRG